MKCRFAAILSLLLLGTALAKPTVEQGRDAAIFGSSDDEGDVEPQSHQGGTREASLFGDDTDTSSARLDGSVERRLSIQLDDKQDPLVIGGSLFLRTMSRLTDDMPVGEMPLSQTAQLSSMAMHDPRSAFAPLYGVDSTTIWWMQLKALDSQRILQRHKMDERVL